MKRRCRPRSGKNAAAKPLASGRPRPCPRPAPSVFRDNAALGASYSPCAALSTTLIYAVLPPVGPWRLPCGRCASRRAQWRRHGRYHPLLTRPPTLLEAQLGLTTAMPRLPVYSLCFVAFVHPLPASAVSSPRDRPRRPVSPLPRHPTRDTAPVVLCAHSAILAPPAHINNLVCTHPVHLLALACPALLRLPRPHVSVRSLSPLQSLLDGAVGAGPPWLPHGGGHLQENRRQPGCEYSHVRHRGCVARDTARAAKQ